MKNLLIALLSSALACMAEPSASTDANARPSGTCHTDIDCDDDLPETTDRCGQMRGECHHTLTVTTGCSADVECDDMMAATADACVARVCHHTITTPAFDPASLKREHATALCESDSTCAMPPHGPYAELFWMTRCRWSAFNDLAWDEAGYPLTVSIQRTGMIRRVRVRLQLRVGDPAISYHVTLQRNDTFVNTPRLIDADFTVAQMSEGFMIELGSARVPGWDDLTNLSFIIRPASQPALLTMQWGIPADGVVDLDTNTTLSHCLDIGPLLHIPAHGVLTIAEGTDGAPACQGTPRRVDVNDAGPFQYGGLVREVSRPEVFYLEPGDNPLLIRFHGGMRSFADWAVPRRVCAQVQVIPDGTLMSLVGWERRDIGIRPGTVVTWTRTDGVRRRGIADRDFVIYDLTEYINPEGRVDLRFVTDGRCTVYHSFVEDTLANVSNCVLDIQPYVNRYEVRMGTTPFVTEMMPPTMLTSYFTRVRPR